jgi:hypothetical protein
MNAKRPQRKPLIYAPHMMTVMYQQARHTVAGGKKLR